ncbi:MAG: response regulator [Desulfuromonadales bacterium]|nr:response regulator [Desulfuromonadales bacterium]
MQLRIVVIDDEECITETFHCHLSDQGHDVITASEPTTCCVYRGDRCDHEHACADILFVDLNMPRMNGLEFVELLETKGCKSVARNRVIMSGALTDEDRAKARQLGCKIIDKPISLRTIDRLIDELSGNIPADRQLAELNSHVK